MRLIISCPNRVVPSTMGVPSEVVEGGLNAKSSLNMPIRVSRSIPNPGGGPGVGAGDASSATGSPSTYGAPHQARDH